MKLDPYPSAPTKPSERRKWLAKRTALLSAGIKAPTSGTFGSGKEPKK